MRPNENKGRRKLLRVSPELFERLMMGNAALDEDFTITMFTKGSEVSLRYELDTDHQHINVGGIP